MRLLRNSIPIERTKVSVYTVPTDFPESDGTLEWDSTTLVLVQVSAADKEGIGYTYADTATATLIHDKLAAIVEGMDALSVSAAHEQMRRQLRNLGRPGICAMAVSAVDCALWDLKARVLDLPLVSLLGQVRSGAPVYGSGGFTSYSNRQLAEQAAGWIQQNISRVKIKIGRDPQRDLERVRVVREVIGPDRDLFVDANGAYTSKQALAQAQKFRDSGVRWFEEPVSSDDLNGMRFVRDRAPAGMDIAAGEYGYDLFYFRRMLVAGAVDVLQADVTRCGGITAFLQVAALCAAHNMPISAHTAPMLHTHVACAVAPLRNVEYFHDHVRIEHMFFNGVVEPIMGELRPDLSRPGNGLELKRADAERFAA